MSAKACSSKIISAASSCYTSSGGLWSLRASGTDNPGRWAFHCHVLYHMEAGMFTTIQYDRF